MRRKVAYRTLLAVALIAFMMNVLLPFYAAYDGASAQKLSELFGDKVLICTSDGFRLVDAGTLPADHTPSHPGFECALCVTAAQGLASLMQGPGIPLAYLPVPGGFRYSAAEASLKPEQQFLRHILSRAPPLSVAA